MCATGGVRRAKGAKVITAEQVRRRLIFDCMADPEKVSVLTGLVGVSDDGAEAEKAASLERLGAVAEVFPMLDTIAQWMADAASALNLENVDEVPEAFREHMRTMFYSVIQGSLVAAFSVLNDLGIIGIYSED